MKCLRTATLCFGVLATHVLAQEPRKPGAEEARLAYFTGRWTSEGESKATPMAPGGKFSITETCEWFTGGFHVVCRGGGTGPMGPMSAQAIFAYDAVAKLYTYYEINSQGEAVLVKGTVSGKVWTWTVEMTMDGKTMKARSTMIEQSPTSFVTKFEASFDGGPWTVVSEAKVTKVQ